MRQGDRRRVLSALGISLALHLGAGALAWRLAPAPARAPAAPIALTLVELPAPSRPPAAPPPATAAPATPAAAVEAPRPSSAASSRPSPRPAPAGPGAGAGAGRPAAPAPSPAPAPAPGATAASDPGPAAGSREWLEAEGLGPGDAAPGRPGHPGLLVPHLGGASGPPGAAGDGGEDGGPDPGGPGAEGTLAARSARVKQRLDGYLQEVLAVDRAERLPDAYWGRLAGRLEAGFDVRWSLLARGAPDDRVVSGSRLGQALAAWQRAAEGWGRSGGSPGAPAPASPRGELGRLTFPDVATPGERAMFVTEVVTRVELVQAADGTVSACRVVGRSGNPAHDALVLERVRALSAEAEALGPAPAQGRRTTWAVRTRFEMLPPVPVVGCSFDATFRPAGCFYPLKRIVKTRVRLERVWAR